MPAQFMPKSAHKHKVQCIKQAVHAANPATVSVATSHLSVRHPRQLSFNPRCLLLDPFEVRLRRTHTGFTPHCRCHGRVIIRSAAAAAAAVSQRGGCAVRSAAAAVHSGKGVLFPASSCQSQHLPAIVHSIFLPHFARKGCVKVTVLVFTGSL